MSSYRLGVDVGGTFTDFILADWTGKAYVPGKCLTTPEDPSLGILEGAYRLLQQQGVSLADVAVLIHGTTLVANTLIERKGARTGLLATQGFQDTLEIGREIRYDVYDLSMERPTPLVPRPLRREVAERLGADGAVVHSLNLAEIRRLISDMVGKGVESLAVCLLHAFRNPSHENAIGALAREEFPQLSVSLSSVVCPEIREYERASTTVANAYVHPRIATYLDQLMMSLRTKGFRGRLFVMLSNGGIATAEYVQQVPIQLIESGPAGGAVAAARVSTRAGVTNAVSFDMGGTTAKICLVLGGAPTLTRELEAARVDRFKKGSGFPLKVPSVDMIEIGAGGGSIAEVDTMGFLKVGPRSAGAAPGPACYGLGGREPTVTDADLVLGYLNAEYFLGGDLKLDTSAAGKAVGDHIGRVLGIGVVEAAAGIHEVVNNHMAAATRVHAAERGEDLRRYTLVAFGGAGPVHAYGLASFLGIRQIVCPPGAGTMSAFGFLVAPPQVEFTRSYVAGLEEVDWVSLGRLYRDLESDAKKVLLETGISEGDIRYTRLAELRYAGQGYEIPVPVPDGPIDPKIRESLLTNFHQEYHRLFGRSRLDLPVEALTWRLRATGPGFPVGSWPDFGGSRESARKGNRPVYFASLRGYTSCPVYDRYRLHPGETVGGPAIIEERESTAVIGPNARGEIDGESNLVITLD